jgi:[ribosomal protein S5]-alanine N-acetyltransferase
VIETERLTLRPLSRDDVEPWTRFMADGDALAGLHKPDPVGAAAAAALDRFVDEAAFYTLVVRETGDVAGWAGFVPRTMDWGDELELGWMLLPAHRGRGLATEAARALHATKDRRIISLIRTDNPASESVARRIGAERERVFEYWGYETGVWVS